MSSPRHKMVVVASPQPNEVEQKRRKQTLERARANHLSKQLQMRLQYAKLKVEHGWQRQNLNEVENLYFHHSHLRNTRPNAVTKNHYPNVTAAPPPTSDPLPPAAAPLVDTNTNHSPTQSGAPDHLLMPLNSHQSSSSLPLANEFSSSGSVPPPAQSQTEAPQNLDRTLSFQHPSQPTSQPDSQPPLQTPVPVPALLTDRSQPTIDLTDPNILARLAQLQAQMHSQPQQQTLSRQSPTTIPQSTTSSQSVPGSFPSQISNPFASQLQSSHPSQPFTSQQQSAFSSSQPYIPTTTGSQQLFNALTPTTIYPPLASSVAPSTSTSTTIPTTQTSIAPALTYDSFWSTHASSTGPTRALYRTHTGFTASAGPSGSVAMLTPGGHTAVMTADGVYVGGNRTG